MSAYLKGGIVCLAIIGIVSVWYLTNRDKFTVNAKPQHYSKIDQMEKVGVPNFQLARLDGSRFDYEASTKGKIVILNFWASWCNPCVQEFPSLIKLVERFEKDLVLVAVSADESAKDIEVFLKAFGLPKPGVDIVWDKDRKVSDAYGVGKIPESFLIGRDGKLIRKIIGIEDWFTEGSISYFSGLIDGAAASPSKGN